MTHTFLSRWVVYLISGIDAHNALSSRPLIISDDYLQIDETQVMIFEVVNKSPQSDSRPSSLMKIGFVVGRSYLFIFDQAGLEK